MHAVHERGLAAAIEEAFILASGDKAKEWQQSTGRPYAACFDYCYWEHRQDMSLFLLRLQSTLPAYEHLIKGPDQRFSFESFLLFCASFARKVLADGWEGDTISWPAWEGAWAPPRIEAVTPRALQQPWLNTANDHRRSRMADFVRRIGSEGVLLPSVTAMSLVWSLVSRLELQVQRS